MANEPSALLFGESQIKALRELRAAAEAAPVDMAEVMASVKSPQGKRAHMDQMNMQTVEIPFGFLVTFSIEYGHPAGPCRHMSMSSSRPDRVPSPEAVALCANELGFVGGLKNGRVWLEDLQRGETRAKAVNFVQPIGESG